MAESLETQAASLRRHAATLANEGQGALELEPQWLDWAGGDEPPVPGATIVEWEARDGERALAPANALSWAHHDHRLDIVKYRVVESQPCD